jgi:hypothetical protein
MAGRLSVEAVAALADAHADLKHALAIATYVERGGRWKAGGFASKVRLQHHTPPVGEVFDALRALGEPKEPAQPVEGLWVIETAA